jgi:hypothetical protein
MAPDKDTKRPSPALVDRQAFLDFHATMGTRLAVTTPLSRLNFSRVVLDFLLCCHNLEIDFLFGGRAAIAQRSGAAPFSFPRNDENNTIVRAPRNGGGIPF